jgi:hypothetical protein
MPPKHPAGIRISFRYDDDIAAGAETLLAVLTPAKPRRLPDRPLDPTDDTKRGEDGR